MAEILYILSGFSKSRLSLKGNFTGGPNPPFLFARSLELHCAIQTKKNASKILIFDEVMGIQSWSFLRVQKNASFEQI